MYRNVKMYVQVFLALLDTRSTCEGLVISVSVRVQKEDVYLHPNLELDVAHG